MKYFIIIPIICFLSSQVRAESDCENLIAAIKVGEMSVVKRLVDGGCNADSRETHFPNPQDGTPLMYAIGYKHSDIALFLIKKGADVNYATSRYVQTPLTHATQHPVSCSVVEALLKKGADPNVKLRGTSTALTPLMLAASSHNVCKVEAIIKTKKVDVNYQTEDSGPTALHFAAGSGDVPTIKALIKAGAKLNIDAYGYGTPRAFAFDKRRMEAVELLQFYEK